MDLEKLEAQIIRAHMSLQDFQEASKYLVAYRPRQRIPVRQALMMSAVIAYARPFLNSEEGLQKRATSRLGVSIRTVLLSQELIDLHERLLTLRSRALAHSDYE